MMYKLTVISERIEDIVIQGEKTEDGLDLQLVSS